MEAQLAEGQKKAMVDSLDALLLVRVCETLLSLHGHLQCILPFVCAYVLKAWEALHDKVHFLLGPNPNMTLKNRLVNTRLVGMALLLGKLKQKC